MPFFFLAPPFSRNKSNLHLSLRTSDRVYHRAACLDTMLFEPRGGLLPTFPLNQQPYPQDAKQYVENDHLSSDGKKQAGGLIWARCSNSWCKPWEDVADAVLIFQEMFA